MASLMDELLKPISNDSFSGEDGSYDNDFETARAEADKSSENNFGTMEESSKNFLLKKSKDMRVLGYLTWASAMNSGADALAECTQAYCKLVMEHWDDIHPKRPAARSNALKWLNGERLLTLLGGISTHGNYEQLLATVEALNNLNRFCEQKFPEGTPTFMGFIKLIKELAEKNKPALVEEKSDTPASGGTPVPTGPGIIGSADDAFLAVQNAAFFLSEQNRSNPLPYRLMRILNWDPIRALPPSTAGRTMIPAPNATTLEAFQNLFNEQSWPDLAKNGEDVFPNDGMIFCFTLQRFICAALIGLTPENAPCVLAIRIELALLIMRLPALIDLSFDDGTPFADAMTKEWIQSDVMTALGGSGGGGAPPIKKKGDVGEEQKQAAALLGEGKLDQALNVLRTGVANDSNDKNNFDRKLLMAELCYKGNKSHIAKPILEELRNGIKDRNLYQWDPELTLSVLHLSQKVFLSLSDSADETHKNHWREKALEIHSQISTLDPVLAIASEIK